MEHRKHFLLFFVLLACGFTLSVLGKPAANVEDNTAGDYYSDDYEDNYDDDGNDENNEVNRNDTVGLITSEPAYFKRDEYTVHANEGSTAILECDAVNLKASDVVIWYNDSRIIVQGGIDMQHNPRVRLVENNGIEIADVIVADAGRYSCQILPSKARLNINLNIVQPVRPDVSIWYQERNISDNILTVQQTGHVELTCQTKNIQNPVIKWSLNGHRIDPVNDEILVEDDRLIIDVVDHEHHGIFQCLADDRSKHPHMTSITLDVLYPPKVTTHRHHINTETNADAELYCEFKANPIGEISWKKDGHRLDHYSEKYVIKNGHSRESNRNRTTLIIKTVKSDDLGNYTCSVKNDFGHEEANMYLTYNPEKPQFDGMTMNGKIVTLHWLVRSTQPLTEAIMNYKIDKSYKWSTDSILNTKKHPETHGLWKLTHTIELTEGLWHAQVKTKNTHGWSHFSADHSFVIADYTEEEEDIDTDGNASGEQKINKAGVFPRGNSASSLNLNSFLPGFSLCLLTATYVVRNL